LPDSPVIIAIAVSSPCRMVAGTIILPGPYHVNRERIRRAEARRREGGLQGAKEPLSGLGPTDSAPESRE
jgi:hypothetical protein